MANKNTCIKNCVSLLWKGRILKWRLWSQRGRDRSSPGRRNQGWPLLLFSSMTQPPSSKAMGSKRSLQAVLTHREEQEGCYGQTNTMGTGPLTQSAVQNNETSSLECFFILMGLPPQGKAMAGSIIHKCLHYPRFSMAWKTCEGFPLLFWFHFKRSILCVHQFLPPLPNPTNWIIHSSESGLSRAMVRTRGRAALWWPRRKATLT